MDLKELIKSVDINWNSFDNEQDEDCCILAVYLTRGTLNINHWEKLYHMDFVNKLIMENGGVF